MITFNFRINSFISKNTMGALGDAPYSLILIFLKLCMCFLHSIRVWRVLDITCVLDITVITFSTCDKLSDFCFLFTSPIYIGNRCRVSSSYSLYSFFLTLEVLSSCYEDLHVV